MGNYLSIAAVTTALRNRITSAFIADGDTSTDESDVTTKPMDQAFTQPSSGSVSNCLNLFLYHVVPSPAWRNRAAPHVKPGETGSPPLTLTLHYLISAQGADGSDLIAHRLLGKAMSCLHDQPLLTAAELAALTGADTHMQVERVRITEQPLTTEEMYKLWSAFQTHYRVSAAYEVSVVMIDSARPVKAPLPALRLGQPGGAPADHAPEDFVAWPRLDLYPTLTAVTPPDGRDYALIGDILTFSGNNLPSALGPTVKALLSHPALPATVCLNAAIDEGAIEATVPASYTPPGGSLFHLPPGVYTLALEITPTTGPTVVTNALPFLVAPEIDIDPNAIPPSPSVTHNQNGIPVVSVNVKHPIRRGQHVYLLLGSQGFPADPLPTEEATTVTCTANIPADDYCLRIRVDGVDSSLLDPEAPNPPAFDPTLKVTIS